jgi:hypothetical protein
MPDWEGILRPREIEALVRHVRELGRRAQEQ